MEDEVIKDDELGRGDLESDELIDEEHPKKPKSLLDDENIESADDMAEDELELDKEDMMDDVEEM